MRRLLGCIFAGFLACTLSFGAARADDFTITYELNSGTNYTDAPSSYTEGTETIIDGIPTKANNVFAGWCTDSTLETCAMTQTIGTDATGDKTFYAKWSECTACAATNATCTLSVADNVCTYTTTCNTGYGHIQNNSAYNASCSALTAYNITYVMNGGTNYDTAPATYYGSVGTTINGTPTKSGYIFAGWCTDSALENCAITQKISSSATGDKTFYAKWEEFSTKFSLTTTSVSSFSFKISASGGFYVHCGDGGTLTSSANDVTGNTIIRSGTTMATYTCTWASAGAHTIEFDGHATGYSTIGSTADGSAISFNTQSNTGNAYSNDVASISGSLGAIFPTLGGTNDKMPMFFGTFKQCRSLTSIPAGLFSGVTGTRTSMFRETFDRCSSLVDVPESLFSEITGPGKDSLFRSTFNETAMTAIPENLFAGVTSSGNNMFRYLFGDVSTLSSYIPPSTFAGLIANGSPTTDNMWDSAFIGTNLATSCAGFPDTEQYITHYEGTGKSTWNGKVSCQTTIRYNVTYDCGVGTGTAPTDSTDYMPNATVTTLANTCAPPTHKLFDKWSCGGNDVTAGGTFTIDDDTTCTAQYIDAFTVSYDCGVGTGTAPTDSTDYAPNATVTTLANTCTAPAHKLFDKWSCGGNNISAGSTFTITANTTCTAQYSDMFTVSYDCGSGTGTAPTDSTDYAPNATVTTLANTCTSPTGEHFASWLCGGNNINAGSTFTITANTTCTAQYGTEASVSYTCGDGTGNAPVDTTSYVIGETVTTATVANTTCTKNGYTLTGWSCGGNAVTAGGTFTITNDITCTAQYTQCAACATSHASCTVSTANNVCTYTTACDSGYTNIQNNGQPNASCVLASSCTGATYEDNNACVACPYNYGYNTETGKVAITQCQAHCAGGTTMSNYTPLEYLENSGNADNSGQYIDTGYHVTSNVLRIEFGMGTAVTRTDTGDYGNFFGNQTGKKFENGVQVLPDAGFSSSYKNKILGLWHQSNSKKLSVSNFSPFTKDVQYDLVYTINDNARSATISTNGSVLLTNNDTNAGPSLNTYATFKVFSNGGASTENGTITLTAGDKLFKRGRVYYLKLWDNGTLVLDLIPARRNSDSVLGFYNNVNGEFYTNVGTGTFTAGANKGTFAGGACADVGDGYYIAESTVNYGSAAPSANQCPDNAATNKQNAASILECEGFSCPTGQYYDENANECTACTVCSPTNATCELSVVNNVCTYTTACNTGYGNIQNNGQYNPICTSSLTCSGATYMNNGVCTACPTGYDYNTTAGKTAISECQIHCDGGTYIATANDSSCSNVGVGYWAAASTIDYGSVGTHTQCSSGLTTVGYGHGADEANDCGRKLHINNDVFYTRQNKITTPSLNFKTAGGDVFYLSLSTTNHNVSRMHSQYQGVTYTAYDDSLINGERSFDNN